MGVRKRADSVERKKLVSKNIEVEEHLEEQSNLSGDYGNIAILFFLYLLQGIPIGLTAAIPMLLQNRGASYKEQAEFSFAHWPFSSNLTHKIEMLFYFVFIN